jgi:hypothetical protein
LLTQARVTNFYAIRADETTLIVESSAPRPAGWTMQTTLSRWDKEVDQA